MLWGIISDKYGRKFALLTGVFGAAIGMAIFGSAKTYSQAIIGRALCGLLSGNLGIIKSFLTEFTDKTNRSKAFSMWSLASTCGNIVGPLLGGYLCRPTEKFPSIFSQDGIFATYPYLLPCLVVVILDVVVSIFCLFAMTETRFSDNNNHNNYNNHTKPDDHNDHNDNNDIHDINKEPSSPLTWIARTFSYNQVDKQGYHSVAMDARDEEGGVAMRVLEIERLTVRARNGSLEDQMGFDQHRTANSLLELAGDDDKIPTIDIDDEIHPSSTSSTITTTTTTKSRSIISSSTTTKSSTNTADRSVLWNPKVLYSTGSYGILAMGFILLDETIPLLLKQDIAEGGMSFSSSQIGTLLALSGAALLIFSTLFLSSMCKGSKLRLYSNYTIASIPVVLGFPIVAFLNQKYFENFGPMISHNLLWIALLIVYTTRNILATLSFSGVLYFIRYISFLLLIIP